MARRFGADQWRRWLAEFEQDDLTVGKFCLAKGVSVQTFYKWRRRLRECEESQTEAASFVSLSLKAEQAEIELPAGARLRVANTKHSLRPIVEVLVEIGAAIEIGANQ